MRVCTLASSSSGNCTLVSLGGTHILIDAGISMRRIKKALNELGTAPEELAGIIVTHEHSDHIGGIKMMTKYYGVRVFASKITARGIIRAVPEAESCIRPFEIGQELGVGELSIKSFRTLHDAPESVGYRVEGGGSIFAFATDLGCVTDDVMGGASGADLAVIEANHDVKMLRCSDYPYYLKERILSDHGHLSNESSGAFASRLAESGTKSIILAHLSRENNTPAAAYGAVSKSLAAIGAVPGGDVALSVAPADCAGQVYII